VLNLLLAIWFFLPAGVANAAPVIANKIPLLNRWNTPLDFGLEHDGRRLLGPNKTWRGFVFGVATATATIWLQFMLWSGVASNSAFWQRAGELSAFGNNYFLLLGALLGAGALLGDAVESYFKRKKGVLSGHSWFPFDQIDYIIGGLLFVLPFTDLTLGFAAQIFVAWFGMHLLFSFIGYKLGLKSRPI